jgi:AraC-like DNA-binding protein
MLPPSVPPDVARARTLVDARLGDELHLRDVARHAGMSKYHFCRVFKATTGLTFNSYVVQARVTRAQQRLLDPQARVSEVAYEVGFQSLSQFNRHFRRLVGECPTRFRAHCQPAKPAFSP